MFKANVGGLDRTLRLVVGVVLLVWPFVTGGLAAAGTAGIVSLVVGAIALLTGLINFCPLWAVIGFNTRAK